MLLSTGSLFGNAGAGAVPMTYSYIGATFDTNSLSIYTYSGVSIGAADASRLIVVAVVYKHSTARTIATLTIDGNGMTKGPEASGGANSGGVAWFYLPWASNTTATFVADVTGVGVATGCALLVYNLIPVSGTPVDSATATGAPPLTMTDLEVRTSGLSLFASIVTGAAPTLSWNGVNTPTHDLTADATFSARLVDAWSMPTTENDSTRDATINPGTAVSIAGISFQ